MPRHAAHNLRLARRGADLRFRELRDAFSLLRPSFPHLRDAFGRADLPLKFILRQGGDKARAQAVPRTPRRLAIQKKVRTP